MTTLDTYVHRKLTDQKNPKKTNSWATYKKKIWHEPGLRNKKLWALYFAYNLTIDGKKFGWPYRTFFFIFRKKYLFFSFIGIGAMEDAFWTTLLFKIWSHWWSDNKSIFRTNNRYLLLSTKSLKMVLHTILYCFWLQVT